MKAIATIKLPHKSKNPMDEPVGKVGGVCPLSGKMCTDVKGSHHSEIVEGENLTNIYMTLVPNL
jgi:hypothetical protein